MLCGWGEWKRKRDEHSRNDMKLDETAGRSRILLWFVLSVLAKHHPLPPYYLQPWIPSTSILLLVIILIPSSIPDSAIMRWQKGKPLTEGDQ